MGEVLTDIFVALIVLALFGMVIGIGVSFVIDPDASRFRAWVQGQSSKPASDLCPNCASLIRCENCGTLIR